MRTYTHPDERLDAAAADVLADEDLTRIRTENPSRWDVLQEWNGCLRKRRHATRADAAAEAEATLQRNGAEVQPYRCPYAEHWHVGRGREEGEPGAARNVVRNLRKQQRQDSIQLRGYRFPGGVAYRILPHLAPVEGPRLPGHER